MMQLHVSESHGNLWKQNGVVALYWVYTSTYADHKRQDNSLFSLPLTKLLVDVAVNACTLVVNMSTIREEVAWGVVVGAVVSKTYKIHTSFQNQE